MGIINLQEDNSLIRELTDRRVVESLPFAGRYRLIDFALSSMVNSGIQNVGIMLPDKPRSVLDHLRSGKDWDLARLMTASSTCRLRTMRNPDAVAISRTSTTTSTSSSTARRNTSCWQVAASSTTSTSTSCCAPPEHECRYPMVYYTAAQEAAGRSTVIETAENGLVEDIAEKPAIYDGSKVSMNVFLMEKRIFVEMIRYSYEHGGQDLLLDGIIRRADEYNIYAYEHDGYVAHVDSTASYYKANMDILEPSVWEELFMGENSIYTKVKDEVPVQYKDTAVVKNSLIANGCIIRGEVENSILFRGVTIEKGVKVKNSIIMQKCDVQENSLLENVICDKNVVITKEKWLKGAQNYPLIVAKNVVI